MNISDIAKMAGVSPAAVSRYLNQGYISEEKKEAIRRLRYEKPNLQICFRTQKALDEYLHYEGSEQI